MLRRLLLLFVVLCLTAPLAAQTRGSWRTAVVSTGGENGGGTPAPLASVEQTDSDDAFTTQSTGYTTISSIGFEADTLALLWVVTTDDTSGGDNGANAPSSLVQTDVTWTLVGTSGSSATPIIRTTAYCAVGDGSDAATITANFADAQTGAIFIVREYTGVDVSSADCLDSLAQISTTAGAGVGTDLATTGTLALSAPFSQRAAGSGLAGGFGVRSSCTYTARPNFTLGTAMGYSSPVTSAISHERLGGTDTEASVTIGPCAQNNVSWAGVSVEIRADTTGDDQTLPTVSVVIPSGNVTVTVAEDYTISGTASDNNDIDDVLYTCDNCVEEPAVTVAADHSWSVTGIELGCSASPGTVNTFSFTALDLALNTSTAVVRRVTCVSDDDINPSLLVQSPQAASITVGPGSQTLTGSASDETAMHATEAVTWTADDGTPTSGTASFASGVWSFVFTPDCSADPGTVNTVTITAKDAADNTTAVQRTLTCVSGDETAPVMTITGVSNCSPSDGSNCTATSLTTVLSGTATDNFVLRATNPVTGSSPACSPQSWNASPASTTSASVNWSFSVTCPAAAVVTHTVTAHDGSGNSHQDTVQVTYPAAALAIKTATITRPVQGVAYAFQMEAEGGTSPYAWDTVTDFDFADDADCAGLDMDSSGEITGTPTAASSADVVCTVRFRVTDDVAATAEKTLNLNVSNGALEGPDDFWDDMNADPAFVAGWQLKDQAEINSRIHQWNASTPDYRMPWRYRFPGADSADCFNNDCNDPLNPPQNAMKIEYQVMDCVNSLVPRLLKSVTTDTPSILRWGNKVSGLSPGTTYRVNITESSLPELLGEFFIIVDNKYVTSGTDGEVDGRMYLDRERTMPFTSSTATNLTGRLDFIECDCQLEPVCGGSDSPHLKPVFGTNHDARYPGSMTWFWDTWFDPGWTGLIKAFGAPFVNNATSFPSGGSFHMESAGSAITGSNGNGSPFDVAVIGLGTWRNATPRPLGTLVGEPLHPSGEGGSGAGHRPFSQTNTFVHINSGMWGRWGLRISLDVPWNNDLFDPWRRHTNLEHYDAGFPIASCTVGATRTTCVSDTFLFNNKWVRSFRVTISGHSDAAMNDTFTALTVDDDADPTLNVRSFTIPNPPGAVGGTGGVHNPHWAHTTLWYADENRDAIRVWFGLPAWDDTTSRVNLHWPFDTSDKAGTRTEPMSGYARNVIALGNLSLDLSGICDNDLPPSSGEGSNTDRGWCTVDATNNPTYFRRPVRDQ